jgi:hypothetical protein
LYLIQEKVGSVSVLNEAWWACGMGESLKARKKNSATKAGELLQ